MDNEWTKRIKALEAENKRLRKQYDSLIFEVKCKFPGESRHDTAKRYIREREGYGIEIVAKQAPRRQAMSNMPSCRCGWPLHDGECAACRVRKEEGLPEHAKCGNCEHWNGMRCCLMGSHGICTEWEEANHE